MSSEHDANNNVLLASAENEAEKSTEVNSTPQGSQNRSMESNESTPAEPVHAVAESNAGQPTVVPSHPAPDEPGDETPGVQAPAEKNKEEGDTSQGSAQVSIGDATGSVETRIERSEETKPRAKGAEAEADQPMDVLLEQYESQAPKAAAGEPVKGRVVAITEAGVVVDIGGKLEGLIPGQEILEMGGGVPFSPGEEIEVEKLGEVKDGYALLSHIRLRKRRIWTELEKASRENATLTGKVVDHIKGGLVVDIGVRAFLPASQLDLKPVHNLDPFKDQEITVRILKLNKKRGNVVVSHRALLEEVQKAQREAAMASLQEGATVRGKVKNIADYGVFVDLGGVDGLLHVSDMVWGRITHPSELVKSGDEIDVQILKFDRERNRISLGRKQLIPDPWATVPERMPTGSRLKGKVVGVTDYGAFVQIEPGVEGLVHVSAMSWSRKMKHPSKIVKVGDEVEVAVLEVRPDIRRISLGIKQTLADPWEAVAEKYSPGMVVNGRVRNVTDFGAFVEIEDGVEGLIHIGDISWTERVQNTSDKFKKGDKVEAKVLKVDAEHKRLSLGVKQLHDPVGDWMKEHKIGDLVRGKVSRLATFGAFVELAPGVEGLCHVSEIEERRSKGEREKQLADSKKLGPLTENQEFEFKLIKMDPETRKISLSYRQAIKQAERKEIETFKSTVTPKSSPTATIGDAIRAKLRAQETPQP